MSQENKTVLKAYFNTGDIPTESNFVNLIDSLRLDPTVPTAHASTGNVTLTFDQDKIYPDVTQTGNITLAVAGSGNVRGVVQEITILGDSASTFTFPSGFISGNGVTFDNTKTNDIYLEYKTPTRILYNILKSAIASGPDVTPPVISSATTNPAGTIITLTYNETLGAVTPSTADFTTSPSKTISSVSVASSTVLVTITPAFVNGNVITINYTAGINKIQDVAGNFAANLTAYSVTNNAGDVTAPTLSSPTATQTGSTTATLGVTTNEANGTLYAVVTTSATPPTAAQVKLGQNNGGSAAIYSGNQAVSSTGAKTFSVSSLTASTTYYSYFMHEDASTNQSTVSAASLFTTTITAQDDFTNANITDITGRTTPIGGKTWVHSFGTGTVGIVSNEAKVTSSVGTANEYYTFDAGFRNVNATFVIGGIDVAGSMGIYVAYVDINNWIQLLNNGALRQMLAGSLTTYFTGTAWASGDTYRIALTSTTITLFKTPSGGSESQLHTSTNGASITGTRVGFSIYQSATASINAISVQ